MAKASQTKQKDEEEAMIQKTVAGERQGCWDWVAHALPFPQLQPASSGLLHFLSLALSLPGFVAAPC
jgi:hypothetical protein